MSNQFIRTELLIGNQNIEKLKNSRVVIFGLGGVGSYVVESLARIGIGNFILVDNDIVSESNINRQLIATYKTIGKNKVDIAKERILDINPQADVQTHKLFYLPGNNIDFIDNCDYIVDAIDTVSAKVDLAIKAKEKNIKIISCMGTGNKLDPTLLEVSDLFKTSVCPLCRVMRHNLKKVGIDKLKVVYSKEEPIKPLFTENTLENNEHPVPGSVSFVPSVAGLIIASAVVKDLL